MPFKSLIPPVIRAFLTAFFAMIGVAVGAILLLLAVGGLISSSSLGTVSSNYTLEILPGVEGTRADLGAFDPVLLQINIVGTIGTDHLDGPSIREMLVESREGQLKNHPIKGILLYFNTPGGTVVAADEIYRALREYKNAAKVPVYAYVEGMCASGGVYISCMADKIYSSETSLVGSVGVIGQFFNVSDLLEKVGVKALAISQGTFKDDMSPFRPWSNDEKSRMDAITQFYYDHFVNIVTSSRTRISKEALVHDYGARVFPARQAWEYGFLDVVGVERTDALRELVTASGVSDAHSCPIVSLKHKKWVSNLFEAKSTLFSGKCIHQIELPGFPSEFANQLLYYYQP